MTGCRIYDKAINIVVLLFPDKFSFRLRPATQSSGVDISSLIGSGSANGVDAKVTIDNPTSSVIIGLDVDISIDVDSKNNVLLVPSEAVKNDKISKR